MEVLSAGWNSATRAEGPCLFHLQISPHHTQTWDPRTLSWSPALQTSMTPQALHNHMPHPVTSPNYTYPSLPLQVAPTWTAIASSCPLAMLSPFGPLVLLFTPAMATTFYWPLLVVACLPQKVSCKPPGIQMRKMVLEPKAHVSQQEADFFKCCLAAMSGRPTWGTCYKAHF